jgi:hypothetical protein
MFSVENKISLVLCQYYPEILKDLTLTNANHVAKSHPVEVELTVKLRPGGRLSTANYKSFQFFFLPFLAFVSGPMRATRASSSYVQLYWIIAKKGVLG